jgi:hypothetical protein
VGSREKAPIGQSRLTSPEEAPSPLALRSIVGIAIDLRHGWANLRALRINIY